MRSTLALTADAAGAGLGGWTIDLSYDPASVRVSDCVTIDDSICDASFAPGIVRIAGASATGLAGSQTLATITVEGVGQSGASPLTISSAALVDPEGATLTTAGGQGTGAATVAPAPPAEEGGFDGSPS